MKKEIEVNDDEIRDLIEDDDEDKKSEKSYIGKSNKEIAKEKHSNPNFNEVCEENTESITCSLGMTIPSNIPYENYK